MDLQRQSNIELCRLISILLVMILHSTYQSLGINVSLGIMLLEGFTIIGVNVFVLITGYFSATPKKTSFINLAFICLFWMIVKVACRFFCDFDNSYKYAFFITSSNWFIPSYIVLLLFAPILNSFCNLVNKQTLWKLIISLLFLEIWFDWVPPIPIIRIGTQNGYSVFSFAILYLLARAIRLYGLPKWFERISPFVYVVCSVIIAIMIYVMMNTGHDRLNVVRWWIAYTNPIVILSSVSFLIMFVKLDIQSSLVNYVAKSTLASLLGHSAIFFLYTKQFRFLYNNFSGFQLVLYWALAILVMFFASIAIDQLRILLFKPIEKLMKKKIKNNIIFGLPSDKFR